MKMTRILTSRNVRLLAAAACIAAVATLEAEAAKKNNRRRPSITTKTTRIKHTGVVNRLGDPSHYDPPPAAPVAPSWEQRTFSHEAVRNILDRVEDTESRSPTNNLGRATTRDAGSMLFDAPAARPGPQGGRQPQKQGGQGQRGGGQGPQGGR